VSGSEPEWPRTGVTTHRSPGEDRAVHALEGFPDKGWEASRVSPARALGAARRPAGWARMCRPDELASLPPGIGN
jgi:hypothetical protein